MVSLVIPIHNRSELLPRLLRSLRRIEGCKVELLFVDNNSDAGTLRTLQTFIDEVKDDNMTIRLLRETKPGSAAARNCGLDAATGDYIYFFDSDDEISPTMLGEAEKLAAKEGADIVALQINYAWPDGRVRPRHMTRSLDPCRHLVGNNFATQSLFLRRDFALKYARWNESLFYWNDFEWAFRILLCSPKVAWLPGTWHKVYRHSDSITGSRFADSVDKILAAHRAIEEDISADVPGSIVSVPRFQVACLKALNCRKALYAGYVKHEGDSDAAHIIYNSIEGSVHSLIDRVRLPLLYRLSAWGLPGVWRLAVL